MTKQAGIGVDEQARYLVRFSLPDPYDRDPAVEGVEELAAELHDGDHDACTFDRANATAHPPMKVC